jgi:hypothetical protein
VADTGKGEAADQAAPPETQVVKRFTDDFDRPLVGVTTDAPAEKILAALKAALADAPEVGFVVMEPPPGGGRVAKKGEAGHKGYRKLCVLKPAPAPAPPSSIEMPPPTLSVLVTRDVVWFSVSRIGDVLKVAVGSTLRDDVRAFAAKMAQEPWFEFDRFAELALEAGVSGATLVAAIEGVCADFPALRIVAPEALSSRPER